MNTVDIDMNSKITPMISDINSFIISTSGHLALANEKRKGIKVLIQEVTDTFGPIKKKTYDAWKETVAQEKKYLEPLEKTDTDLKSRMGQFMLAEQQAAEKEANRLAEIARKEKEKEIEKANKKLEVLMEKAGNLDAQIEALSAELQNQSIDDEAAIIRAKLNGLLAQKESLERKVSVQATQAEQITATPQIITPIPEKPKIAGLSFRTEKKGEIINKLQVIKAVAAGTLPLELVDINNTVLNRLVKAGMNIAGVDVVTVPITQTRGR